MLGEHKDQGKPPGAIVMWLRKDTDVLATGETIVSFQASNSLQREASGALKQGTSQSKARVTVGLRPGGKLAFEAVAADGTVSCRTEAPKMESLTEGGWHHVAAVFDTHPFTKGARVTFYVDGASTETRCKAENGASLFDFNANTFGASMRTVLVGAHYTPAASNGRFEGGLDARLDDFAVYGATLTAEQVKGLAVSLPCARDLSLIHI